MSQLLEEILSRDNMMQAYKRVVANKGASGVDGITTDEVRQYLIENWENIREQITASTNLCRCVGWKYPSQTEGCVTSEYRVWLTESLSRQ